MSDFILMALFYVILPGAYVLWLLMFLAGNKFAHELGLIGIFGVLFPPLGILLFFIFLLAAKPYYRSLAVTAAVENLQPDRLLALTTQSFQNSLPGSQISSWNALSEADKLNYIAQNQVSIKKYILDNRLAVYSKKRRMILYTMTPWVKALFVETHHGQAAIK